MRKRNFLAPLGLTLAVLIASVSGEDKALMANASPTIIPKSEPANMAQALNDTRILHDFVLKRGENNIMMAEHYSHSSHSSHSSHRSHYSGY